MPDVEHAVMMPGHKKYHRLVPNAIVGTVYCGAGPHRTSARETRWKPVDQVRESGRCRTCWKKAAADTHRDPADPPPHEMQDVAPRRLCEPAQAQPWAPTDDVPRTASFATLDAFNYACPVGTRVLAFPGSRDGRALLTRTRSMAWLIGDGHPVVMVEGYAGGIALTHIEVMPEVLP